MVLPVLLFAAALAVNHDGTVLRAGCSAEDEVVSTLPAGTRVEVRYAIADGSNCVSVAASVDGKRVEGYVPGDALTGADQLARESASAGDADGVRMMSPAEQKLTKELAARPERPELAEALARVQGNQAAEALKLLEPVLRRNPKDADALVVAGLAAYRTDDVRGALDYWKQSMDLRPDNTVSALYARAEREMAGDKSGEKIYGNHVLLRYEGEALPADTARDVVHYLDSEFLRISSQLGCAPLDRIVAVVQSPDAYFRTTGAAEWSDGLYDGRIHVAMLEGPVLGAQMKRVLAHETAHACLTSLPSGSAPWPAWLQEGIAQFMAGDRLSDGTRAALRQMAEAHQIPKLEQLSQSWTRMNAQNARLAYGLALDAAEQLFDGYQNYGIRNVLNNPDRLPQVAADLDQRLGF